MATNKRPNPYDIGNNIINDPGHPLNPNAEYRPQNFQEDKMFGFVLEETELKKARRKY